MIFKRGTVITYVKRNYRRATCNYQRVGGEEGGAGTLIVSEKLLTIDNFLIRTCNLHTRALR